MLRQNRPLEGMSFHQEFLGLKSKVELPFWRSSMIQDVTPVGECPRWNNLERLNSRGKVRIPSSSGLLITRLLFLLGRSRCPVRLHLPSAPILASYRRSRKLSRFGGKVHHNRRGPSPVSVLPLCNRAS